MTNSLGMIQLLQCWTRTDNAPRAEAEIHWDLLKPLLDTICECNPTACMMLKWVEEHSGDPSNTVADLAADRWCDLSNIKFVRTTTSIKIYGMTEDDALSLNGWNGKVEKQGRLFQGRHAAV